MKTLDQTILCSTSTSTHQLSKSLKISLKCLNNNPLYQFCVNKQCKQPTPFVCNNDECICNQNHQSCQKRNIKLILKRINQKIINNVNQLKSKVQQIFTNMINQISQFEEFLNKQIKNQVKNIQLMDIEKKFKSIFIDQQQTQQLKYFNGAKLSLLCRIVDLKNQSNNLIQKLFEKYLSNISSYKQTVQKQITRTKQQINKVINHFNQLKTIQQKIQKQKLQKTQQFLINLSNEYKILNRTNLLTLIGFSSIIKTQQQVIRLKNFFAPHNVKSISVIFKANQHNFQIKKYYQQCGTQQNTIILVQTTKNKILGGFTPLCFSPISNKSGQTPDPSGSSFIFSLTNNDKFQLIQKQHAIIKYQNKSRIHFYGPTLLICDKANINNDNSAMICNNTYQNGKYSESKESYLKFNGNQTHKFIVKDWEVLKVLFEQ